jgi:hypothetical protein
MRCDILCFLDIEFILYWKVIEYHLRECREENDIIVNAVTILNALVKCVLQPKHRLTVLIFLTLSPLHNYTSFLFKVSELIVLFTRTFNVLKLSQQQQKWCSGSLSIVSYNY